MRRAHFGRWMAAGSALVVLVVGCTNDETSESGGVGGRVNPTGTSAAPTSTSTTTDDCPIFEDLQLGSSVYYSGDECRGADISGRDLSGADLEGGDLSGAKLVGTNLSRADLTNANLSNADLTRANLNDATAPDPTTLDSSTSFANATLVQTNLAGTDLDGADFTGAVLKDVVLDRQSSFLSARGLTVASVAAALGVRPDPDAVMNTIFRRGLMTDDDLDLDVVCAGRPQRKALAPSATTQFHPVDFVLADPGYYSYDEARFKGPSGWTAPALAFAQYVACVRTVAVELETCSYRTSDGDLSNLIRYRQDATVRIVEAKTARQVARQNLQGGEPAPCPDMIGYSGADTPKYGAWPAEAVRAVAQPFVGTPPPRSN